MATGRRRRRRSRGGGFLSTSFDQPVGSHIEPAGVGGYYVDLRVKAEDPRWPPPALMPLEGRLWVLVAQWGLGAFEHFLASGDRRWLAAAEAAGGHLVDSQTAEGPLAGGWPHTRPYPHTYRLDPPWLSSMAQGEGASLLVRLALQSGEARFAEAARRALAPLSVPTADGGVRALLEGRPFPEEYPTDPASFVLNGAIFSMWGLRDVGTGLGDGAATAAFEEAVDTLAATIHRWDLGYWSRYDLHPHRAVNVASPAYHRLHTDQLRAMALIAPRPELEQALRRFERYGAARANRARALAAKVRFRLLVSRRRAA